MTTREIAEAVGKDESTIRRWVRRLTRTMPFLAGDMPVLADKIASSSPANPADYSLEEVMLIIEIGLGKNAAALWAENAKRSMPVSQTPDSRLDRMESMIEKLLTVVVATVQAPRQIEFVQDYYTIKGFASKMRLQLTYSEAVELGRKAKQLSEKKGLPLRKADDERFGTVNSYPVEILEEVFPREF